MSATRHKGAVSAFDAVVVVGSQGAFDAFRAMLASMPGSLPVGVIFDLHRREDHGIIAQLLARRTEMPVKAAADGMCLEPGAVYVAPADPQLVVCEDRVLRLIAPPDGTGHRCADPLLQSAAGAFGSRLIAVVLSGRLDGGAKGVREVKRRGGRVLVQTPGSAVAASMPNAALATGCVDFALAPEPLAHALVALCGVAGAAELFRVRMHAGVHG